MTEATSQESIKPDPEGTSQPIKSQAQDSKAAGLNRPRAKQLSYFLFNCPCCVRVFSIKKLFRLHLDNMHKDVGTFLCELCQENFRSTDLLISHIWKEHGAKRKVPPCPFCGLQCTKTTALNVHVVEYHSKTCPVCVLLPLKIFRTWL